MKIEKTYPASTIESPLRSLAMGRGRPCYDGLEAEVAQPGRYLGAAVAVVTDDDDFGRFVCSQLAWKGSFVLARDGRHGDVDDARAQVGAYQFKRLTIRFQAGWIELLLTETWYLRSGIHTRNILNK